MGGALGQTRVSCCLCSAQGHLVEATKLSVVGSCSSWARRHLGKAVLQAEASCRQCPAGGHVARGTGCTEAKSCFGDLWEILGKPVVQARISRMIWMGWGLRNHQGGANGVCRVNGGSDLLSACTCWLCRGRKNSAKAQWCPLAL